MSTKMKIALVCYLVVAVATLSGGLVYFLASQIMPYHQQVIGVTWDKIDPRIQKLFLAFMNGTGFSGLIQSLTLIVLILIPFRKGERWARWTIPGIILTSSVYLLYITLNLKSSTQASTPWQLAAVTFFLGVAGLILAYRPSKQLQQNHRKR
jgi:peptidoglycan/LPS O-acetylase OafA/YrhL